MKNLTENDFDKKYTLDPSVKSEHFDSDDGQTGMLETFGNDMGLVLSINKSNPLKVWTMVDADDGMYLVNGLHYVNRIYYIITVEPAENEVEEYLFDQY